MLCPASYSLTHVTSMTVTCLLASIIGPYGSVFGSANYGSDFGFGGQANRRYPRKLEKSEEYACLVVNVALEEFAMKIDAKTVAVWKLLQLERIELRGDLSDQGDVETATDSRGARRSATEAKPILRVWTGARRAFSRFMCFGDPPQHHLEESRTYTLGSECSRTYTGMFWNIGSRVPCVPEILSQL